MVLFKTDEEKRIEEERKLKKELDISRRKEKAYKIKRRRKAYLGEKKVQWKSWTDSSGFKFFWIMGCSR